MSYVTMQITFVTRKFRNVERNLHCDVMPLSRRLDRCDRVIQDESGDSTPGVMCNTSQCELRSLRVNSGMLNVIRIVTYMYYTLSPLESPDSFWIAMAFSR